MIWTTAIALALTPVRVCTDDQVFPPSGASVPASLTHAALVRGDNHNQSAPWTQDGQDVAAAGSRLTLTPLTPGTTTLAGGNYCHHPIEVTWTVTEAAPLPNTLGAITLGAPEPGNVELRGRTTTVLPGIIQRFQVELSEEARPWKDTLQWSYELDGEAYRSLHTHPASLVRTCNPNHEGLTAGPHSLVAIGQVAGTHTTLRTPPQSVALSCPPEGSLLGGCGCENGTTGWLWPALLVLGLCRRREA